MTLIYHNQESHPDESGNQVRQYSTRYGFEGELLSSAGDELPISYAYDSLYRTTSTSDGNNALTLQRYNVAGYLAGVSYPGAAGAWSGRDTVQYSAYDADGNCLKRVDGNNVETDYTYADAESKLTRIEYPGGSLAAVECGYDVFGRLIVQDDGTQNRSTSYDDLDNVLSVTSDFTPSGGPHNEVVSYTYNNDGSRASMSVPTGPSTVGTFTYEHDAGGRMQSQTNPVGSKFTWTYLANNWATTQSSSNSSAQLVLSALYAYDQRGEITNLTNQTGDGTVLSAFGGAGAAKVGYDASGNLVSETCTGAASTSYPGTTSYIYDSENELTSESSTRNGGYSNQFVYDGAGNFSKLRNVTLPAVNSNNQLTADGYVYDGNGNPTTYAVKTATYDPECRLTSYSDGSGLLLQAGYSADSLRAWRTNSSGVTSYFVYDGDEPVVELSSTGALVALNTFGLYGLLARFSASNGSDQYYAFDTQGNNADAVSSNGTVLYSSVDDAYGNQQSVGSTTGDPYSGFGAQWGYYSDPGTNLLLLSHRYYDPVQGRFINRDPIGTDGGSNVYNYTSNDPTALIDPTGYRLIEIPGTGNCFDTISFINCVKAEIIPDLVPLMRECGIAILTKTLEVIADCLQDGGTPDDIKQCIVGKLALECVGEAGPKLLGKIEVCFHHSIRPCPPKPKPHVPGRPVHPYDPRPPKCLPIKTGGYGVR